MAKQVKKESIEEVVNNEITEVVDKVTTPTETEKTEDGDKEDGLDENLKSEPTEQPEPVTNSGNVEEGKLEESTGEQNSGIEQSNPEPEQSTESKSELETKSEPVEERTELSTNEGGLIAEIFDLLAKCNWFNHLNIGQYLNEKHETTKENLELFFNEYKTGNYLASQEDYDVFRKLNEYFNN